MFALLLTAFRAGAESTPAELRSEQERKWVSEGVPLVPHQPSYFFPFTYNTNPHGTGDHRAQHKEAKFQLSFKVLLIDELLGRSARFYFGYTQLSLWQVYDQSRSAPFRDTNYEPELFVTLDSQRPMGYFTLRQTDIGLSHQSNGVSPPDSRSWNRIYARLVFDSPNVSITAKPWVRIPDSRHRDDNPDIDTFMGYGELTLAYMRRNHILSVMLRNNLRASENKGAIQVDYSFPLTNNLTGLLQWFNGYGESLIDYNQYTNRFSIGIALGYGGQPLNNKGR